MTKRWARSAPSGPGDLTDVLTELALAEPAVVALRSLARVTEGDTALDTIEARNAAARVAWGMRSLFSGPEVTALLDRWVGPELPYWQAVLRYGIDGNVQAVMDEYLHVLREWRGFASDSSVTIAADLAAVCQAAIVAAAARLAADTAPEW